MADFVHETVCHACHSVLTLSAAPEHESAHDSCPVQPCSPYSPTELSFDPTSLAPSLPLDPPSLVPHSPCTHPALTPHSPRTHISLTPQSRTKHTPQSPSQLTLLPFPELILLRQFMQLITLSACCMATCRTKKSRQEVALSPFKWVIKYTGCKRKFPICLCPWCNA